MTNYIDRDSLYERLEEEYQQIVKVYSDADSVPYIMGFGEAIDALKNEPSETNLHKIEYGDWININNRKVKCSRCSLIRDIITQDAWNFCPACGAKMLED